MQSDDGSRPQDTARRRIRLAALFASSLLLLLALVSAVGSFPAACGVCHGSLRTAMAATGHAETACYACHLKRGAWGFAEQKSDELFRMYPARLIGRVTPRVPADATSREACAACHADVLAGTLRGANFNIRHEACATGPSCDACHGTTAHGTTVRWRSGPVMEECVSCHSESNVRITCATCHSEGEYRRPTDPSAGPWQVRHGANWEQTHGLGSTDGCVTCHPDDYCTRCHGLPIPHPPDFGGTHGSVATGTPGICDRCHRSADEFCDACHGIEMPHPEGFLERHSSLAAGMADESCFRCHADNDCEVCHSAHIHPGGGKGVPVPWTLTPEERRP